MLGFGAVVIAAAQRHRRSGGVGGAPFVVILIALCALSALFGARKHRHWLSDHVTGAAFSGVGAGILNGAAILAFGVASTWGASANVAVLLFIARFTFIVWPAFILHGTIAAARRRAMRTENAV